MKLIQLLLILTLTTSFLANGIVISYADIASTSAQHCTASNPCKKICGDHVCGPNDTYLQLSNNTNPQNSAPVSIIPQMPMTQNNTFQNTSSSQIQIMTGISSIYNMNGTRMVSDSKMCLAGVDRCVMIKMLHAPPLKQMNVGIGALDVNCKTDFQLILKTTNNLPACVSPSTASELVKRGWALSSDAMMNLKMSFEPTNQ